MYYLPRTDSGKLAWLKNFANKLPLYNVKYGISAAELDDIVKAALFLEWALDIRTIVADYSTRVTAYKDELIDGISSGATAATIPSDLVLPAAPPSVAPGIFDRATSIGGRIKKHVSYTPADGKDLGLEGAEGSINPNIQKPAITLKLEGGHPVISWKKGDMSALKIMVNRGDGKFTLLTIANTTRIVDNFPLPTDGATALWTYKVIYMLKDQEVGDWSGEFSIAVVG